MKIKRFLIVFTFITALFLMVSVLNISTANAVVTKKTPSGLLKTPGAMATQNAINQAAGIDENPHGKPVNYQGVITAIDDASITITLKDQSSVTVAIITETIIRYPRGQAAEDQLLTPGMTVMVHAILGQDDLLTARRIILIPKASPIENPNGKPVNYQGVITAIDDVSITITLKDQSSVTVAIITETIIRYPRGQAAEDQLLTPGMTVMVHAILGQDDLLTARRIILIPK
ncbi:MAG: hypothetical protein FP831_14715, partial [Anaerolineae bacterium]|nr:hypothetical protein [Anaerolineae bacterium]